MRKPRIQNERYIEPIALACGVIHRRRSAYLLMSVLLEKIASWWVSLPLLAFAMAFGYMMLEGFARDSPHTNLWFWAMMVSLLAGLIKPVGAFLGREAGIRHAAMHYND